MIVERDGSRLLVTNLANLVQPLVRYVVEDDVELAGPCSCGSTFLKIAAVKGRTEENLRLKVGNREVIAPHYFFKAVLCHCTDVMDWQAEQVGESTIRLHLQPVPGEEIDLERVDRVLRAMQKDYGLSDIIVWAERVKRIEPDPKTGKVRHVVGLTSQPTPYTAPPPSQTPTARSSKV